MGSTEGREHMTRARIAHMTVREIMALDDETLSSALSMSAPEPMGDALDVLDPETHPERWSMIIA